MNLPENFQEVITSHIPVFATESSPEMQWVEEVENLVVSIKENINCRNQLNQQLENIKPEIDELLARLAEKQAEEEKIKAGIESVEEECARYKELLFEKSGQ